MVLLPPGAAKDRQIVNQNPNTANDLPGQEGSRLPPEPITEQQTTSLMKIFADSPCLCQACIFLSDTEINFPPTAKQGSASGNPSWFSPCSLPACLSLLCTKGFSMHPALSQTANQYHGLQTRCESQSCRRSSRLSWRYPCLTAGISLLFPSTFLLPIPIQSTARLQGTANNLSS